LLLTKYSRPYVQTDFFWFLSFSGTHGYTKAFLDGPLSLSFFLSWLANTQVHHWKWMLTLSTAMKFASIFFLENEAFPTKTSTA